MRTQEFDDYFKRSQEISRKLENEQGGLRELLRFIEKTKDISGSENYIQEFFTAEYAFYDGQYERSLPHYLQAKGIPHFEFFCFRASAYIANARGDDEKALKFIKRALEAFPDDYCCLMLLNKVLPNPVLRVELSQDANDVPKIVEDSLSTYPLDTSSELIVNEAPLSIAPKLYDQERKPTTKKIIGAKEIEDLASFFRF